MRQSGRWNELDRLWTEGNKLGTWSVKCGLKQMRWNLNSEVENGKIRATLLDLN